MKSTAIDMTNKCYGRLIVKERRGTLGRMALWLCKCSCGKELITTGNRLRNGDTKSCGCLKVEAAKYAGKCNITHGDRKIKFYHIWSSMKARLKCDLSYGHVNLSLEWEWYENFKKDMHKEYLNHCFLYGEKNTTIDRINNNKGYSKNNCRWATYKVQNRNRNVVKSFVAIRLIDNYREYFETQVDCANKFNLGKSNISQCLLSKAKTHKGWIFQYV